MRNAKYRIHAYSTPAVYKNLRVFWWRFIETPGKYAINYYICAGLDPDVDPYDYDKVYE